jgi:hypothetical protein
MKSYMEKNNLHYFTFSPDSEKTMKAVFRHLPPDTPANTHLKLHESFFIPNYHFYQTDRFPRRKVGTAVAVSKDIPHKHSDLPPFVSSEAVEICIPIGNSEVLLAAVRKSPDHAWNDADIIKLLSFRHNSLLAGNLNAKHHFGIASFPALQARNYWTYCI